MFKFILPAVFCFLLLTSCHPSKAQSDPGIIKRIEELKEYSLKITELMPEEDTEGVIPAYNDSVAVKLVSLLKEKDILKYNLDSLLSESAIQIHTSEDKKLKIFNWYTNSGGVFPAYYEIVFAQTSAEPIIAVQPEAIPTKEIFLFQRKEDTIYMVKQSGSTCSSCIVNIFRAIRLKPGISAAVTFFDQNNSMVLEGLADNIIEFAYFSDKKEISVIYYIDKVSKTKDQKIGDKVQELYRYNGEKFVKVTQ